MTQPYNEAPALASGGADGPEAAAAPLIGDLPLLPAFLALSGRRVALAGGSHAALWKAELLQAAGAHVDVVDSAPCDGLVDLARRRPSVRLLRRPFVEGDLDGAALVVADCADLEAARRLQDAARARGVPCNVIDKPAASDFQFGAVVERAPVVVAVSTAGASPILAQALRGRIEALLPARLRDWARAAQAFRAPLKALRPEPELRRRFWDRFNDRVFSGAAPRADEFDALLACARAGERRGVGSVALVGAGPGDPELLTLKALRLLQGADVILYDDLVAPQILDMARREARKIPVGKRGYRPSCKQDEIVARMIALAQAGERVVRLKGGDPMVFGRAAEEIAALDAAGVPVEVVPGVTAALGAAASLKISLTERARARRLQFVTAHGRDGRLPEDLDWSALADPGATSVVYMGARMLGALREKLLAHGADPAAPALIVERATCADERRAAGTLADLAELGARLAPSGPCLVMIGAVFGGGSAGEAASAGEGAPPREPGA